MIQLLEASSCLQRMVTSHVFNIAMEPFEEVGGDKGLSKNLTHSPLWHSK